MRYFQFDRTINTNNSRYKLIKISLLTISIIILISSIIYIYYSNNSNFNNTRRKIDKIEGDITNLYNYTETMSDFIVDNYKPPEINLKVILEEIKNETNKLKLENKELKKLINKNENRTKLILEEVYNKQLKLELENIKLKNRTEVYLRSLAFDCIGRLNWNQWFGINHKVNLYYGQYTEKDINKLKIYAVNYFNNNFDKLYKIDYDNFLISFSNFSNNVKENYEIIMKIFFNETIEFDEKNIIKNPTKFNNINSYYDTYYYKFIRINVIPSVKFIDEKLFIKVNINGLYL